MFTCKPKVPGPPGKDGYGNCGSVFSVTSTGALSEEIQAYTYDTSSGLHGAGLDATNEYLYTADDSGNMIWTGKLDSRTGELTFVSNITGRESGSDPRHLVVHPAGQYLYAVYEATNAVGVYSIDQTTHEPSFVESYSLLPSGAVNANYTGNEVLLSFSGNYLQLI